MNTDTGETITWPGPQGRLTAQEVLHTLDKFPQFLVGLLHLSPGSISLVQGRLGPLLCLACLPTGLCHLAEDATTFCQCPLQFCLCVPGPTQCQVRHGYCPIAAEAPTAGLPIVIPAAGTPTRARSTGCIPRSPTHLPGTERVRDPVEGAATPTCPTLRLCLTSSFMPVRLRLWVRAERSPSARWLAMCLRLKSSLWVPISNSVRCRVSAELLTGLGTARADMLARRSASADRLCAWRMLS